MAFNGTGSNVTSLNASNISSGTVATARLGSGSPSSSNFLRGDGSWQTPAGAPSPLHGKQVFTSSGTFNVPTGVTSVLVTVIGAGGNGGNGSSSNGGGGGAGGYIVDYVSVTSGGTATVTVGTNGGSRTSSFAGATTITASGGSNGATGTQDSPGNGYLGLSGASTIFGVTNYLIGAVKDDLTTGFFRPGVLLALSGSIANGGGNGSVYNHGLGAGGGARATNGYNQQNALGYGAGAGGGSTGSQSLSGGTGTNGIVIVEW
jgi:hypothetical protein